MSTRYMKNVHHDYSQKNSNQKPLHSQIKSKPPVLSTLGRLMWKNHKFKIDLGYMASPYSKYTQTDTHTQAHACVRVPVCVCLHRNLYKHIQEDITSPLLE